MKILSLEEYKTEFANMLYYYDDIHEAFNKKVYTDRFGEFYDNYKPLFESFEEYYNSLDADQKDMTLSEIASAYALSADAQMVDLNRRKKEIRTFDFNLTLVAFVNPSLMEFRCEATETLAKKIVEMWNEHFPKEKIGLTMYGDISTGFKKKFCYITTATCKALSKGDNCKELESFRRYRDEYLERVPGGDKWIHDYYDLAPTIIKGIDSREYHEETYSMIWNKYLAPCYELINKGENEKCREIYQQMVDELASTYVYR